MIENAAKSKKTLHEAKSLLVNLRGSIYKEVVNEIIRWNGLLRDFAG